MPEFMYMLYACEQQLNFLNCPTFKNSSLCEKTYSFVQKTDQCTLKYEKEKFMRQEFWFYEEVIEETDEFQCIYYQLF